MLKAVLFDLDDTLLGNNMRRFLPAYFTLLTDFVSPTFPNKDYFFQQLLASTQAVVANQDPTKTNLEVFWSEFRQRMGNLNGITETFFEQFYQEKFPELQPVTQFLPTAPQISQWCLDKGWKVAITTNPLFPTTAVTERLHWAGLSGLPFHLVTTMDNMHATKPHHAYYQEVLTHLGVVPAETLMVGDDWDEDIVPASTLGCHTYWITPNALPPTPNYANRWGSLTDLYRLLQQGWLQE